MMNTTLPRFLSLGLVVTILSVGTARDVSAQGFISPLIGFDFGGDSGCPAISGCEDKTLNVGVAVGALGDVLGFEAEFAYARNFFGDAPGLSSSVFTLMGNVMLAPRIGPLQPYALAGLGLMKSHVDFTLARLFTTDNNDFAWDVGGGIIAFFGEHVGIRGDLRYFHAFQDLEVLGLTLGDTRLDFGRASAALVLKF
jgi:opacity protein-like surface antigen